MDLLDEEVFQNASAIDCMVGGELPVAAGFLLLVVYAYARKVFSIIWCTVSGIVVGKKGAAKEPAQEGLKADPPHKLVKGAL